MYSEGMHELITEVTHHSRNNGAVIAAVWKTYAILLEDLQGEEYAMALLQGRSTRARSRSAHAGLQAGAQSSAFAVAHLLCICLSVRAYVPVFVPPVEAESQRVLREMEERFSRSLQLKQDNEVK